MSKGLYYGTKNALKQCGLYEEKSDLSIFDIIESIKIDNNTILTTKTDLEKYCEENNLCVKQIEENMIDKFYEWFSTEMMKGGDANVNE